MPDDFTVLLLESERLPDQLKAELTKRDVLFEAVGDEELTQILPVLDPDLIVRPAEPDLISLLEKVQDIDDLPPLVVIVERSKLAKLRGEKHVAIQAYIPSDLAPAAIAHRLTTLAKRHREGRPLAPTTPTPSRAAPGASGSAPEKASVVGIPSQAVPSRREFEDLKSGKIQDLKSPSSKSKLRPFGAAPGRAGNSGRPGHTGDTLRAAAAPQGQDGVAGQERGEFRVAPLGPPPEAKAEFSVLMAIPVNARESLTDLASNLTKVRLALLDTDLMRADALASALRERGILVHPVTPDPVGTRWPLLRRFAPQGLVVDEKSLTRGSAEWVEHFRGDPFLRHVPLIVQRFSRLFRDDTGEVKIDPLFKSIEPLGKEEFVLLEKLRPGRQVDLTLAQVPPLRLLMMLTSEDRNTRLDCQSEGERMVWHLGPGYAGKAKILKPGDKKVIAQLTPEEALTWLVSREDCQVAVHEHTEPLAHASESKDAVVLMEAVTAAMGAPVRHESLRPGNRVVPADAIVESAPAESEKSDSDAPDHAALGTKALQAEKRNPRPQSPAAFAATVQLAGAPAELRSAPTTPSSLEASRAPLEAGAWPSWLRSIQDFAQNRLAGMLTTLSSKLPPGPQTFLVVHCLQPVQSQLDRLPERARKAVPIALVALALLLLVVFFSLPDGGGKMMLPSKPTSPQEPTATTTAQKEETKPEQANGKAKDSPTKPLPEDGHPEISSLFVVAPDSKLSSCEEKLKDRFPGPPSVERSANFYRQARSFLMQGEMEEAWEVMCSAGLLHPTGPAADGLAEFYLSRRSLAEAEKWVRSSLSAEKPRRATQELLGDVESQKGNVNEARRVWLETMKLDGDEEKKLKIISRKHIRNAQQAQKGGDLARAEREIRRAVTLQERDPAAATEFAAILSQRGKLEAAEEWAARARELDFTFGYAFVVSGKIAEARNKQIEAAGFYDKVSRDSPYYHEAQKLKSRL
jgi:Flp pilus assembly protein TadD